MTTLVKTSQRSICLSRLINPPDKSTYIHLPISESIKIVIPFNILFPSLRVKTKELLYCYICTLFVGPTTDEQNLSMKATVICHYGKPSPSEKRLHKGTLES